VDFRPAHRCANFFYFAFSVDLYLSKLQMNLSGGQLFLFGHLNFGDSNLPFDWAQGGELVEPFRISCFGFCISGLSG
jgi:hypothetical protein